MPNDLFRPCETCRYYRQDGVIVICLSRKFHTDSVANNANKRR